jgi:pilus assembly protein CpaC
VELRDGQTFAIAGLLNNSSQSDTAAVPILSQLPIIGNLFKSKADRQERTELLVLITPRLVRPLDPDEVPPLPTLPGRFLPPGDDIGQQLEGGGGTVDGPEAR